ncbi:MAG TPA: FtsW/RodA/SpoVE family cell cycle protein, partial [Lachnospiraceae bacterium]|nr:FtsW/RodA/SpoVE family cell cycle protein [Lachnospiraceae bacterium]
KLIKGLKLFYIVISILLLGIVAVAGRTTYGAKINITIGSIAIQPSEFVKILMVLFIACMLVTDVSRKQVFTTVILCGVLILILAYSRDLGNAMIFYLTLLVMVYAATQKPVYLLGGVGLFGLAAVVGYFAFSHVQTRVLAWKDPLAVIDSAGYQISQSLFAIGTGGWFGTGLYQGMPKKIPVVETDFIFSAISEELGGLFALCLIFICIANFLMMFNIALQINNRFYKLIALGLGALYASQVFTTLGGVTKFIPSTGVTLPLISYGGSSLMATMLLFAMVEGLYHYRGVKEETDETEIYQRYAKKNRRRG